jgi:hypothetical protein
MLLVQRLVSLTGRSPEAPHDTRPDLCRIGEAGRATWTPARPMPLLGSVESKLCLSRVVQGRTLTPVTGSAMNRCSDLPNFRRLMLSPHGLRRLWSGVVLIIGAYDCLRPFDSSSGTSNF